MPHPHFNCCPARLACSHFHPHPPAALLQPSRSGGTWLPLHLTSLIRPASLFSRRNAATPFLLLSTLLQPVPPSPLSVHPIVSSLAVSHSPFSPSFALTDPHSSSYIHQPARWDSTVANHIPSSGVPYSIRPIVAGLSSVCLPITAAPALPRVIPAQKAPANLRAQTAVISSASSCQHRFCATSSIARHHHIRAIRSLCASCVSEKRVFRANHLLR